MTIKEELYRLCAEYVEERVGAAKLAIADAKAAGADDTKSSAGDKYETTREMMQQEISRNETQLAEALKLKLALSKIDPGRTSDTARPGSLVTTDCGTFYLAVSAGRLAMQGKEYFAISPASPAGIAMAGKQAGDAFLLNGKQFRIVEVS